MLKPPKAMRLMTAARTIEAAATTQGVALGSCFEVSFAGLAMAVSAVVTVLNSPSPRFWRRWRAPHVHQQGDDEEHEADRDEFGQAQTRGLGEVLRDLRGDGLVAADDQRGGEDAGGEDHGHGHGLAE